MTSRITRLSLVASIFIFSTALLAQAPASAKPTQADAKPNGEEMIPSFKISGLPIDGVLAALEFHTGRSILRPAALPTAEYTLVIDRPIPRSELILAIETLLALNQIGVAPLGDRFLKVIALAQAKTEAPEMIAGSAFDQPASGKIATKVFQFDFLRVNEFMPQLQGLLTPGVGGGVVVLEKTNAAIVTRITACGRNATSAGHATTHNVSTAANPSRIRAAAEIFSGPVRGRIAIMNPSTTP